jgi:hypothetical protein
MEKKQNESLKKIVYGGIIVAYGIGMLVCGYVIGKTN